MEEDKYKKLLESHNKLQESNKKKKEEGIDDYSLMNALLKKNDEVHLHSNFIYSMINPRSSHYCKEIFLKLFLEYIKEEGFIEISNARVHKEKGKIDLLIEDGKNIIIIENKLDAADQYAQINRYILHVLDKYLDGKKELLSDRLQIVYLSQTKEKPSIKSESIKGFELEKGYLVFGSEEVKIKNKKLGLDTIFKLKEGTKIKFSRVKHSDELILWVDKCISYLKNNTPKKENLIYAFKEYELILKRLKNTNWRKIMALDEYMLKDDNKNEEEEKEMYAFVCEANKVMNNYLGKKLYRVLCYLFKERERCTINKKEFKEFTEENCIAWFKRSGYEKNYKDVGFKVKDKKIIFALGVNNISFDSYEDDYVWNINDGFNRKSIQKNIEGKDLFSLLKKVKDLNKD